MINQAKNNANLYDEMQRAGYEDNEFPEWSYSPARVDVDPTRLAPSETVSTE